MTAYIYCCAASAMRTAYGSQLQSSEKRDELQFRQSLLCANYVQGRSQGGPGVPVTPLLLQAFFNQTTYNRWRKCHDNILAIVTIW